MQTLERVGAMSSRVPDEAVLDLVASAIQFIGAGLNALTKDRQDATTSVVHRGGRLELRVAIGDQPPVVSLVVCELEGREVELGHVTVG